MQPYYSHMSCTLGTFVMRWASTASAHDFGAPPQDRFQIRTTAIGLFPAADSDAIDRGVKVADAIGYIGEIGADVQTPVNGLYLNANAKYLTVDAEVDAGATSAPDDELDVDTVSVGAGLGYRF